MRNFYLISSPRICVSLAIKDCTNFCLLLCISSLHLSHCIVSLLSFSNLLLSSREDYCSIPSLTLLRSRASRFAALYRLSLSLSLSTRADPVSIFSLSVFPLIFPSFTWVATRISESHCVLHNDPSSNCGFAVLSLMHNSQTLRTELCVYSLLVSDLYT